jgi:hypothetical protein
MFMTVNLAVRLVLSAIATFKTLAPQEDFGTAIDRAEAAYYAAHFEDSAAILSPLNLLLDAEPGRSQEKIRVKLQLALTHIGLNELDKAKMLFSQLYELDPRFELDREKFAPKVLKLAYEVKNARDKAAVDVLYKEGSEAFNRGDLVAASARFRAVLELDPQSDLATAYLNVIEEKRAASAGRIALLWHKQFDEGNFQQAADTYRQLASSGNEGNAAALVADIEAGYRKAVTTIADSWKRYCAARDESSMVKVRTEAENLLPDTSMARDVLDQMSGCASSVSSPPPAAETTVVSIPVNEVVNECIQNPWKIAVLRLKERVDPPVPAEMRHREMHVRVTLRIDGRGNTSILGLQNGSAVVNKAIYKALREWTFHPAKVDSQPRCVESELTIVMRRGAAHGFLE